ncbi:MAG TPA: hypothetical protein VN239_09830 [Nitrososphaera sp.]|jgi:hypothetical protein|nr:hypothetical protein [Nitrososphaera sp.]
MSNDSTGEKIKEKVMETKDKVKETVGMGEKGGQGIKDKVKETIGMEGGRGSEAREGELGPGAASKVEEEVAKTSSDSPTKKVEGPGKALGKEEGSE